MDSSTSALIWSASIVFLLQPMIFKSASSSFWFIAASCGCKPPLIIFQLTAYNDLLKCMLHYCMAAGCVRIMLLALAAKQTNKLPFPWPEWRMHSVCPAIMCIWKQHVVYETRLCFFHGIYFLIFSSTSSSLHEVIPQLWTTFWTSALQDNKQFLRVFTLLFRVEKWTKIQLFHHFLCPNLAVVPEIFLVSALFIVSVCYMYTTGFEINNPAIAVSWTTLSQSITSNWFDSWVLMLSWKMILKLFSFQGNPSLLFK